MSRHRHKLDLMDKISIEMETQSTMSCYRSFLYIPFLVIMVLVMGGGRAKAVAQESFVYTSSQSGAVKIVDQTTCAPLIVSKSDHIGVIRAVRDLQDDFHRVAGQTPTLKHDTHGTSGCVVLVGTLGKNAQIDQLIREQKLDVSAVKGLWETYLIQVVNSPWPGVTQALVIAGSDKRGTIYGIYDLAEQIGVSPWHWWADVPVKQSKSLWVANHQRVVGPPKVKYRGIFLNDEEPALGRWAVDTYGGFNHTFYEKLFELILRLKGNFLWPAMWWASFSRDDPLNAPLADEMGIVISTTHHEPMMRAHAEWKKSKGGAWNYETNAEKLRQFWTEGIERMGDYESIVTLAMRGDGDMAMSEGTNIALLEKIVADQRQILAEVTGQDLSSIPQVWALYKEVQDYYDKGMQVPDDVTLLLCDDNWGNVRRLPKPNAPPRAGGYGMYYHFDYVGGPRSYKWLNVTPLSRIWEQMHLCYRHGVDRIWLVNVGDLKPMEYPISFFLDYAWDPEAWPAERLPEYAQRWAGQQFGEKHATTIAEILTEYTKYNSRRTPEMLSPDTYSLSHYREAETVVTDYLRLADKAEQLARQIPSDYQDAYFQLVLHPVIACANLNELHVTTGRNHLYAQQGRTATNDLAQKVDNLFKRDQDISHYYNKVLAGGKWNHMMDQTHISYTSWQQPREDVLPELKRIDVLQAADMGVAIEGSDQWWPSSSEPAVLPSFDSYNQPTRYIEVFNRGQTPFKMEVDNDVFWIKVSPSKATIKDELRLKVNVDWQHVPVGTQRVPITIKGPQRQSVTVQAVVENPDSPAKHEITGFVEADGYVCMEAEHYAQAIQNSQISWERIPDMGRTLSGMMPTPVTATSQAPGGDSPRLEYGMHLFTTGPVKVHAYFCPTQNFQGTQGLRYAVSFDDNAPQFVNVHENETVPDWKHPVHWNKAVSDNIKIRTSEHQIDTPGMHVLKFWMVDPGLVLQRIVVDTGGFKPSYLGPPESYHIGQHQVRRTNASNWTGTWACSIYSDKKNLTSDLTNMTLRQVVRVSIPGNRIRLTLSNAFSESPLVIKKVHLAESNGGHTIDPDTDISVTFNGRASVTIPAGGQVTSDVLDYYVPALAHLAVSIYYGDVPATKSGHVGSRTTSYLQKGDAVSTASLTSPLTTPRWYTIAAIDVEAEEGARAVVALGDSITDGYGTTTDAQNRWTDHLATRLQTHTETRRVGVLNQGIGATLVSTSGLKRLERDVLAQTNVDYLIVLYGVNDILFANFPASKIISAYQIIINKAHEKGILIYGGTIMPFGSYSQYTPAREAVRQEVNAWIRETGLTAGGFDAVIDFDWALRAPQNPMNLNSAYTVDGLHPNPAGYQKMAEAIDLELFAFVPLRLPSRMSTPLNYTELKLEDIESVWLEAECAIVGGHWDTLPSRQASNGRYVIVKPGIQSLSAAPAQNQDLLVLPFAIQTSGMYAVFARMNCPTADDDSFWVKMDNSGFQMHNGLETSGWEWKRLLNVMLSAGDHNLTIGYREDGAQLDKISISNDLQVPKGMGGKALNCDTAQ